MIRARYLPQATLGLLLIAAVVTQLAGAVQRPRQQRDRGQGVQGVQGSRSGLDKYYALVIGNNDYRYLRRLETAVNDAKVIDGLLREAYGFESKLLLNATRNQILSALNEYRRGLDGSASLLIYYAGHGYFDKDAQVAYWIPVDAETGNNVMWISAYDVTTNIKGMAAKHVLVVSDSCYSGMIARESRMGLTPAERDQYLERMSAGKSRTLMSSGGNEPVNDGGRSGHSVFAAALLKGLRQMDTDVFASEELFYRYVREPVTGQAAQVPEYNIIRDSGHDSGDFVFSRRARAEVGAESSTSAKPGAGASSAANEAVELEFWRSIQNSTDPRDFRAYIEQYPNGRFVSLAKNRLDRLGAGTGSGANVSKPEPGHRVSPGSNAGTSAGLAAGPNGATLRTYEFETVKLDSGGTVLDRRQRRARYFVEDLADGVRLEMVGIPGGSFLMGSPAGQEGRQENEGPQHQVTVSEFYIGKFEVTQRQWRAVARMPKVDRYLNPNPANFKGDDLPVEQVSWDDAMEFCARLSRATGRSYRLPSEAEWEYACRAGTTTPFGFGETITLDLVNYDGNYPYGAASKGAYRGKTSAVGSLQGVNGFGLSDMHGNVWEWCLDVYHSNYVGAPSDGSAWVLGGDRSVRILRGGSWFGSANAGRSANRSWYQPASRYDFIGFRVVIAARI